MTGLFLEKTPSCQLFLEPSAAAKGAFFSPPSRCLSVEMLLNTVSPGHRWAPVGLFWCGGFLPLSILQTGPFRVGVGWYRDGLGWGGGMTGPRGAELVAPTVLQQTHHFAVLLSPSLALSTTADMAASRMPPPQPPHLPSHPTPPQPPVSLQFLTPRVSEPATAGKVHVFSHKGNVDVYAPCADITVYRPVARVCSIYTAVL